MDIIDKLSHSSGFWILMVGAGIVLWGAYDKWMPTRAKHLITAIAMIMFILGLMVVFVIIPSLYLRIFSSIVLLIVSYLFYWIFLKNDGENRRLL